MQFIQDNTDIEQWHYIPTHDNTQDDASIGLDSKNLGRIKRWFNNPEFLWSCKETWLEADNEVRQINYSGPKLKNEARVNLTRINDVISRLESITHKLVENEKSDGSGYLSQKQIDKDDQKTNISQRALKYQPPTLKKNTPLFFVQSLPKPANCPNHPFLGILSYVLVFCTPPPS